jgi:hypothetical protein
MGDLFLHLRVILPLNEAFPKAKVPQRANQAKSILCKTPIQQPRESKDFQQHPKTKSKPNSLL